MELMKVLLPAPVVPTTMIVFSVKFAGFSSPMTNFVTFFSEISVTFAGVKNSNPFCRDTNFDKSRHFSARRSGGGGDGGCGGGASAGGTPEELTGIVDVEPAIKN